MRRSGSASAPPAGSGSSRRIHCGFTRHPWSPSSNGPHRRCMPVFGDGRRWTFRRLALAGGVAVLLTVGWWPTSRLVGVDYVVSRETLPLWRKVADFIERDAQLRRTSRAVLGSVSGDEAKALATLAWTRANIRYAPGDKAVIDDHISNVIDARLRTIRSAGRCVCHRAVVRWGAGILGADRPFTAGAAVVLCVDRRRVPRLRRHARDRLPHQRRQPRDGRGTLPAITRSSRASARQSGVIRSTTICRISAVTSHGRRRP